MESSEEGESIEGLRRAYKGILQAYILGIKAYLRPCLVTPLL